MADGHVEGLTKRHRHTITTLHRTPQCGVQSIDVGTITNILDNDLLESRERPTLKSWRSWERCSRLRLCTSTMYPPVVHMTSLLQSGLRRILIRPCILNNSFESRPSSVYLAKSVNYIGSCYAALVWETSVHIIHLTVGAAFWWATTHPD